MRRNHDFNFYGGDQLSKISASWLVAYMADETGLIPNTNTVKQWAATLLTNDR